MCENEKNCCGTDGAHCRSCPEQCGPPVVAEAVAELDDTEIRAMQDIALPFNVPHEDIAAIGGRAFFDPALLPFGFAENMVLVRSIYSRNRLAIMCREKNNRVWAVFDGYVTQEPDGRITFSSEPPSSERLLKLSGWQRWRLRKYQQTKGFLQKVVREIGVWWVGRPRYDLMPQTGPTSRSDRFVG